MKCNLSVRKNLNGTFLGMVMAFIENIIILFF